MHKHHDLDLLAAFVEGTLEDTAPAEALMAACPECAEVVASHQTVRAAIAAHEVDGMTDLERHRLRSSVWDAFSAETAPSPARSSTPWWYRVVPVAAALVVIVGVAANLPGGDEAGSAPTTQAGVALDSPFSAAQSEMADTTEMASEGGPTATTAPDVAGYEDTMPLRSRQALDSAVAEFEERAAAVSVPLEEGGLACVEPDDPAGNPLAAEDAEVDGRAVWMVAFGPDPDQIATVRVYAQDTCEVLYPVE